MIPDPVPAALGDIVIYHHVNDAMEQVDHVAFVIWVGYDHIKNVEFVNLQVIDYHGHDWAQICVLRAETFGQKYRWSPRPEAKS